jgi:hypothetical protein
MSPKLSGIKSESFVDFGCSEGDRVFNPFGPVVGDSLEEMKKKYEAKCDREFAARVCARHPGVTHPRTE